MTRESALTAGAEAAARADPVRRQRCRPRRHPRRVAREAGVSRATVSRVVNGSPKVSPDVRRSVERAVARLGYVPNPAARRLVTRRSDSVGLVITEPPNRLFDDPFFPRLLRGISAELSSRDLQLVLLMPEDGDADGAPRALSRGRARGRRPPGVAPRRRSPARPPPGPRRADGRRRPATGRRERELRRRRQPRGGALRRSPPGRRSDGGPSPRSPVRRTWAPASTARGLPRRPHRGRDPARRPRRRDRGLHLRGRRGRHDAASSKQRRTSTRCSPPRTSWPRAP